LSKDFTVNFGLKPKIYRKSTKKSFIPSYITIGIEALCDIVVVLQDFKDKRDNYTEEELTKRSKALSAKKNTYGTVIKKDIYRKHVWKENCKAQKIFK